jgi:hypothetical protein
LLLALFRLHDTTLCSSSLSWRSRPEKLTVASLLQFTSSPVSPSPSASASSHGKDDDDAEGTVSVPVDPDAVDDWCRVVVLAPRHVAVVAVDVVVSVAVAAE